MDDVFLKKISSIKRSKFTKPVEQEEIMMSILSRIDKLFNSDESDFLIDLVRCQKLIIHFTKELDYAQADEIIALSKSIIKSLDGNALILGRIFLYPSLAYHAKKNKNLALAKRYINQTIKYDDILTPVFPVLHIHKLHHILNLHQLMLVQKKYRECAAIFVDVFIYLYSFELPSSYGISDRKYLLEIHPKLEFNQIMQNFSNTYFLCIWENPIVENFFLENVKIRKIMNDADHVYECVNAFKDFNFLQTMFSQGKIDFNLFLIFFNKYDLYLYDIYRLLLLKNLYSISDSIEGQNIILDQIKNKLNFKFPDKLIQRIHNPSMQ